MLVQFQHSPFILTLILIAMPRDIEQDLAINCAAPMLGLGTNVQLVELYFSQTLFDFDAGGDEICVYTDSAAY